MTYFEYLKNNYYKTLTTEIKLECNIFCSYTFTYVFDNPINLINIKLPPILDNSVFKIMGSNSKDFYFLHILNLCNIEYFNNYNCYIHNVKKITLIVNEIEKVNYLKNHKIKIEYCLDKIYKETKNIQSFYIPIRLKNINDIFLFCRNILDDKSNTFKLIKKTVYNNSSLYLYKINLDMFKNLDGDTDINNYIKNNYNYLDINNIFVTLYDKY